MSLLRELIAAVARRRHPADDPPEHYRFWHLNYGEAAYYDQAVFKRHRPTPPESSSAVAGEPRTPQRL